MPDASEHRGLTVLRLSVRIPHQTSLSRDDSACGSDSSGDKQSQVASGMHKRRCRGRLRSQAQPSISHTRGAKPDPMDHISRAMERGEQHSCGEHREGASERAGHDWKLAPAKCRLLKNGTEKQTQDQEVSCRNSRHNLMAEVRKERNGESRCYAGNRCESGVEDSRGHPSQRSNDWPVMTPLENQVQRDAQEK